MTSMAVRLCGCYIAEVVPSKDMVEDGMSSLIPCKPDPARLKIAGPGELSSTFPALPTIVFLTPYHSSPIVTSYQSYFPSFEQPEPCLLDTIGLQLSFQAKVRNRICPTYVPRHQMSA
jgi:hypothetical protein